MPALRLFLGGDVMTGRGIDQILRMPSDPRLHEGWVTDARGYVELAERASGPIPREVGDAYVWGDLLADLDLFAPDLRIVNLETAITRSERWERKGINYRMHPDNAGVLTAAGLDACVLANNHVMDWGEAGLLETMQTLRARGIAFAGAGMTGQEAWAPRVLQAGNGRRVLIVACASTDCGVPAHWAGRSNAPGIAVLPEPASGCIPGLRDRLAGLRGSGDVLIVSVHWGGNWGYEVPDWQRNLAHALVEECGADIVFGHSSHHPKAAELYRGRLILYGCGDLLNDYEGIGGHEDFPTGIALGYFVEVNPTGARSVSCRMKPYRIRRFRLERAAPEQAARMGEIMARECARMGAAVERLADGGFGLVPAGAGEG